MNATPANDYSIGKNYSVVTSCRDAQILYSSMFASFALNAPAAIYGLGGIMQLTLYEFWMRLAERKLINFLP